MAAEVDAVAGDGVAEGVDGGAERLSWVEVVCEAVEENVKNAGTEGAVGDGDAKRMGVEGREFADVAGDKAVEGEKGRERAAQAGVVRVAWGRGTEDEGAEVAN